jgi:predicted ATP-dependent protease
VENSNAKNLLEIGVRELMRDNSKEMIMAAVEEICDEANYEGRS